MQRLLHAGNGFLIVDSALAWPDGFNKYRGMPCTARKVWRIRIRNIMYHFPILP
jgi:hypothetical protein